MYEKKALESCNAKLALIVSEGLPLLGLIIIFKVVHTIAVKYCGFGSVRSLGLFDDA